MKISWPAPSVSGHTTKRRRLFEKSLTFGSIFAKFHSIAPSDHVESDPDDLEVSVSPPVDVDNLKKDEVQKQSEGLMGVTSQLYNFH